MYALTKIKGVGRRYCKYTSLVLPCRPLANLFSEFGLQEGRCGFKQEVALVRRGARAMLIVWIAINRAGEITSEELERIVTIIQNPTQYK